MLHNLFHEAIFSKQLYINKKTYQYAYI